MLLWLEFAALFVLVPLGLWLRWLPPGYLIGGAVAYIVGVMVVYRWRHLHRPFVPHERVPYGAELRRILRRFALLAPLLLVATVLLMPEHVFSFPQERPRMWAVLMLTYPVYSALPQELIYRAFFFWRYRRLVGPRTLFIALNAVSFGLAHLFLDHWLSIALTVGAGVVFSYTYLRTRTLHLVWLEHALYGNLLFTIGLGHLFYKATI